MQRAYDHFVARQQREQRAGVQTREAQVGNLDNAVARHENVCWLEVAVQDPVGVQVRQAVDQLMHKRLDAVLGDGLAVDVEVVMQDLLVPPELIGEKEAPCSVCADGAHAEGRRGRYQQVVLGVLKHHRDGALDGVEHDVLEIDNVAVLDFPAQRDFADGRLRDARREGRVLALAVRLELLDGVLGGRALPSNGERRVRHAARTTAGAAAGGVP